MAITNLGYNGQVSAAEMALIQQHAGVVVPVVGGKDDFAVTANNSGTLTCNVAPGEAYAPGVRTKSDAVESKTFNAVLTIGATRWDAVVLRRSYAGSGSTTIEVVQGTAAANAPAVVPAGVDLILDGGLDQLLALVQFTYGSTIPTAVLDRRAWAHPVYQVSSVAALPTAAANLYGMEAIVGADRYQCLTDQSLSPAWVKTEGPVIPPTARGTINITATGAPGASAVVTFPVGRFSTAPTVLVSRLGGSWGKAVVYVGTPVTTTGFTVSVYTGDGTNITNGVVIPVNWFATL